MAVIADALGLEDPGAAGDRRLIRLRAGDVDHEGRHVADLRRRELQVAPDRRHVGDVARLRVAGADAVEDGPLDVADPAEVVEPDGVREVGRALGLIALHVLAVAGRAVRRVGRPGQGFGVAHKLRVAGDLVRIGDQQTGRHLMIADGEADQHRQHEDEGRARGPPYPVRPELDHVRAPESLPGLRRRPW